MNTFYFTFGTDEKFPFCLGWVEVEAPYKAKACEIFREHHPDRNPNEKCLNCAGVYTKEEFLNTNISKHGKCHARYA